MLSDQKKQQIIQMYLDGHRIADIVPAVERSQTTINNVLRESGVPRRPLGAPKGTRHPRWKGGRYIELDGYVLVRHEGRYVRQHRLVMEEHLGRPLTSSETVHHINGDRADNRIENLQLRHSAHGPGARLICACCGSEDIQSIPLS